MSRSYRVLACPACASTSARLVADADALKAELEDLWQFQLSRRRAGVPTRKLYDRAFFTLTPPLQLVACTECGTLYRNPGESEEEVVETYAEEQTDAGVFDPLFEAQKRAYHTQARALTRLARGAGNGLEVGSYVGGFMAAAGELGWNFEGVDVNAEAVAFARAKGLTVSVGSLDSLSDERRFDAIAIWNCFDQLPDPQSALLRAHELLRPGGVIALRVPNGACYTRWHNGAHPKRLSRLILAHNNLLGFPYRQGFTPHSLRTMLERSGFELKRIRKDVLVSTADEWTTTTARLEERWLKQAMRVLRTTPWFEAYATRR
jgi:2-polyprenyl-3-methyl-5-hydroxy-6-metoxy-1,4-benzoquinol methylase